MLVSWLGDAHAGRGCGTGGGGAETDRAEQDTDAVLRGSTCSVYIPREDRLGETLTSPSLLSAATFKKRKREKTERKKRQKQTGFNTGKSLLHFFKKKKKEQKDKLLVSVH